MYQCGSIAIHQLRASGQGHLQCSSPSLHVIMSSKILVCHLWPQFMSNIGIIVLLNIAFYIIHLEIEYSILNLVACHNLKCLQNT